MATKQKDESFDFMKGVLILLVVYGHVISHFISEPNGHGLVYDFIYSFHMPAFFLVSGYFSRKALSKSFSEMIQNKSKRIVIPAAIWSAFSFILLSFWLNADSSLSRVLIKSFRSEWYLWTLFAFYVMAGAFWKSKYKYFIGSAIAIVLWLTKSWQTPYFFSYFHITREWPCFLCGLIISEIVATPLAEQKRKWLTTFIKCCAIIYIGFFSYKLINGSMPFVMMCIMMLSGGFFANSLLIYIYKHIRLYLIKNILVKIGNATLGIYLMNEKILRIIDFYIPQYTTSNLLLLFIYAIMLVAFCYGCNFMIRKNSTLMVKTNTT